MERPDVVRHHQTIPHLVPAGAIQGEHGERPLGLTKALLVSCKYRFIA